LLRTTLSALAALLTLIILYLLLWPIAIDPVAWQAPVDRGFIDPFAPNDQLKTASGIHLGNFEGPEDATVGAGQHIYVTTYNGVILKIRNRGVSEFANVGGRPLGIIADSDGSLLIANAYRGIQRVSPSGEVASILSDINGEPLIYANSLTIAPDGTIFFSNSSNKFGAQEFGGTYEAAVIDLLEHGGHGHVYAYDPQTGVVDEIIDDLNFANGIAISEDGSYLLVAETGSYRILKHWISGDNAGTTDVLMDNLPAFPDNIKRGKNGRFWIGFASPRNAAMDKLSDKPLLRKVVQRLPASLRPSTQPYSQVIAINGDGKVLMSMRDIEARFPTLTGVIETHDTLYLTTLFGNQLPRLAKRDL
jgi:sugar lactone lactonase YvrE